jgi:hypothetical protein
LIPATSAVGKSWVLWVELFYRRKEELLIKDAAISKEMAASKKFNF